ncbi:MAG: glucose-6-phosphate dehydrogenase [Chloroherpetonaceae bacterium]|nr:glucose-6-phosphate dehydrogenase [Chthonomonadaceae bacterium]MDW8206724.1 glucose-6-phosphate dehydrogenase [Chloroherpetonaceae bacterium]
MSVETMARPVPLPQNGGAPASVTPCAFVLFGATGDLTRRKIVPALFDLDLQGLLPDPFVIIAFARRDKDDTTFREDLRAAVREFAPQLPTDGPEWQEFARHVFYLRSNLDDPEGYRRLAQRLQELDRTFGLGGNRLFYLATPPDNFDEVITHLGVAGLNRPGSEQGWARLIIEKPFGYDLNSARQLNALLAPVFAEHQVYRIDHYLGKEAVQNILVLRFANQIFEPLWNQKYIDNVQITVAETLGMEGRGAYFEKSGITRDIVQNHALQVLTLVAMEPPVSLAADHVRDEKVKVLKSIRPFTLEDVAQKTVRGQYGPGFIETPEGTRTVPGYREEQGVDPLSSTETFAAFRFDIQNWRWAGVPFYVQAGKRLPKRVTEVQIQFKAVPEVLFARLDCTGLRPNRLIIRIQPDEGAWIEIASKVPGPQLSIEMVRMDFRYGSTFNTPVRDAYQRLLLDAIRGDASLFARGDEVEAAWELLTPVLDAWQNLTCPIFPNYPAGTWGPPAVNSLLSGGRVWHIPQR